MDPHQIVLAKKALMGATGLSQDALHIYVGLFLLLGTLLVTRRPLGAWLPLLVILAAAITGECFDLRLDLIHPGHWRWKESLHDVLNTMFWPVLLTVLARARMLGRRAP